MRAVARRDWTRMVGTAHPTPELPQSRHFRVGRAVPAIRNHDTATVLSASMPSIGSETFPWQ